MSGSFDPELNLIYYGTGQPNPEWTGSARPGDNLYSDSIVALDVKTGKLKWHFQKSLMPTDYDKRLTAAEFKDLLAFLTRQGTVAPPSPRRGGPPPVEQ